MIREFIPNNLVNILKHYPTGLLANLWYGFPSRKLKIIGVTGTDGKTTTCTMIYHVLKNAGKKVALISTVSAKIGHKTMDTGLHVTSPDHFPLQKFLKLAVDENIEYLVLETTSHGFDQHRFWGIKFFAGIITNITGDHLDYHKTWEKYAQAKAKLFKNTKYSILNIDDKSYKFLNSKASGKIITYGLKKGDYNLKNSPFKLTILGDYNNYNGLATYALCDQIGIDKTEIKKYLKNFSGVTGRMQVMHKNPLILIDFAHNHHALNTALNSLKKYKTKNNKIISLFGCAGFRDETRRKMGLISAKNADITIITADDPRGEGVEKISNQIEYWAKKGGAKEIRQEKDIKKENFPLYIKIPDRQEAINFAVKIANKNDIVGLFGKGHEKSICIGKIDYDWSDQAGLKKALKQYA